MCTLANSAKIQTNFRGKNILYFENSTCDPLKYTMGSPKLIVSICMGKSIRIQGLMITNDYLCWMRKAHFEQK